ncbi:43014_t:CDS:2, partial [Gigaspora margarita]
MEVPTHLIVGDPVLDEENFKRVIRYPRKTLADIIAIPQSSAQRQNGIEDLKQNDTIENNTQSAGQWLTLLL